MSINFDENKNREILSDLQRLGLTEKEAKVYGALIGLGEVGSSKIIRATGLHGQYVYQALDKLELLGLVQHVIKRGCKKFSAKNPKALSRLVSAKQVIADSLSEKLSKEFVFSHEQEFEVFQGVESYIDHEFNFLEQAPDNSTLLVVGGAGDQFIKIMGENMKKYETLRLKKNIPVRYLGSKNQFNELKTTCDRRGLFEFRILPGLFTGVVNTNIWPTAIGFNVFGSPVTSFVVYNPVIAGSYSMFFEALWSLAAVK